MSRFHTRFHPVAFLALALIVMACLGTLQGCASSPGPTVTVVKPTDFAQTELVSIAIASEVLTQADILLAAQVIQPADARSLVRQTDQVKADVQLAKSINLTDPANGLARINLALQTIQGVRNYLAAKGATFSAAASG